jgi:hypothetical protein
MFRQYAAVFFRAATIVSLTAANVVNVSGGHYALAFLTGGLLSAIWWGNSRTAAHTELPRASAAYAFGAACGTVFGMWIGRLLR